MNLTKSAARYAWIHGALLSVLFVGAYWIPITEMIHVWLTNDDYSYGILIPFVSAYLFWDQRYRLRELKLEVSWRVLPLLLVFICVSIYGILGSSGHVSRPSIPILIILIAAFCFGEMFVKKFALPFGFLVFMVPLPTFLDRTIGVFLKSVSSQMGGFLIKISGISVHVTGNVIDLGVTKLQVVDACSGLRFVFPLLALGVVYAYFFEKRMWKKWVCVLSTLPIAVLTNGLRIGITGILTEFYGSKVAEGFFHDFSGWIIFMFAFAVLFLLGRMLRWIWPDSSITQPYIESPIVNPLKMKVDGLKGTLVSAVLLLIVTVLTLNTQALPGLRIKGGIQEFPLRLEEWRGRSAVVDPEIIERSGAEESFSGYYANERGENVSLYIGYRGSAFLENSNFFHSPTVCLPGSGWSVRQQSTHRIDNVPFFNTLHVTKMVINSMGADRLVYFWFQTKNRTTHDKNINRFHLAMHAIKHDNTHDMLIRPITTVAAGEQIGDAEKRLDRFVRSMMKELLLFLKTNQYEES